MIEIEPNIISAYELNEDKYANAELHIKDGNYSGILKQIKNDEAEFKYNKSFIDLFVRGKIYGQICNASLGPIANCNNNECKCDDKFAYGVKYIYYDKDPNPKNIYDMLAMGQSSNQEIFNKNYKLLKQDMTQNYNDYMFKISNLKKNTDDVRGREMNKINNLKSDMDNSNKSDNEKIDKIKSAMNANINITAQIQNLEKKKSESNKKYSAKIKKSKTNSDILTKEMKKIDSDFSIEIQKLEKTMTELNNNYQKNIDIHKKNINFISNKYLTQINEIINLIPTIEKLNEQYKNIYNQYFNNQVEYEKAYIRLYIACKMLRTTNSGGRSKTKNVNDGELPTLSGKPPTGDHIDEYEKLYNEYKMKAYNETDKNIHKQFEIYVKHQYGTDKYEEIYSNFRIVQSVSNSKYSMISKIFTQHFNKYSL